MTGALLFGAVAGDAPLAERRAQALAIDQAQLRELLGAAELRELLDADALAEVEAQAQQLDPAYQARSVDGVHDLLLRIGDLTRDEIAARSRIDSAAALETLVRSRRAVLLTMTGEQRAVPVEYVGRYRDALGVPLPPGLPEALLQPVASAASDVARRYARTRGPFTTEEFAARYGLGRAIAQQLLKELSAAGRLLEGEFRPGGSGSEWCDPDILASVRRRSLAKLRRQVEPVEPHVLVRLLASWQGVIRRRSGLDALLDTIDNLQGVPLAASIFESEILSGRIEGYTPADLDALCAAGEVVWCGVESVGERDGRLALYLTDSVGRLRMMPKESELTAREQAIIDHLAREGASFFAPLHQAAGAGFPQETVDALWDLVWKGLVTNDTFHAVRAFTSPPARRQRKPPGSRAFRTRRVSPPAAEGRWGLVAQRIGVSVTPTEWSKAVAEQLLSRYGVLTREVAGAEGIYGGFSAVYDVLKALEDAGRVRRGYFVSQVGATQFALPAALELLRSLRELPDDPEVVMLSATDPANPYGTMLKWTAFASADKGEDASAGRGPTRTVGAQVIFVNGHLAAYLSRGARQILVHLPEDEALRGLIGRALARQLATIARASGLLIAEINGARTADHPLAVFLAEAGFSPSAMGFMITRRAGAASVAPAIADRRLAIADGSGD